VSFAGMREGGLVKNIERYTGNRIEVHTLPGWSDPEATSGRPASAGRPRSNSGPRAASAKNAASASAANRAATATVRRVATAATTATAVTVPTRARGRPSARNDAPRGNRFEQAVRGRPMCPHDGRPSAAQRGLSRCRRGARARTEVNGNSVEYWEKREREAKAKAATARSYGDRGNSARPGQGARPAQPRSFGNENRGGGNRVGVRVVSRTDRLPDR